MTTVAIVGNRAMFDHGVETFDGFTFRYRHMHDALTASADVAPIDAEGLDSERLLALVRAHRPDVVITPAYLGIRHQGPLLSNFRCVLCIEEEVPSRQDRLTMPLRERARRRARQEAERLWLRPPLRAVIINERERHWAENLLPRTPIDVVPLAIDDSYWATAVEPAVGMDQVDAVVAGTMAFRSNAEGLAEVASEYRALTGRARSIAVASAATPHAALDEAISQGDIRFLGKVDDVRRYYRAAPVCLIPTFVVPGTKSTILQAWAAGVPVVTSRQAAASVSAVNGRDLLAADSPIEVARLLRRAVTDPVLCRELAVAGRARLQTNFAHDRIAAAWRSTLEHALDDPLLRPSLVRDTWARATKLGEASRAVRSHGK